MEPLTRWAALDCALPGRRHLRAGELVDALQVKRFDRGAVVVERGAEGDEMFVIESGKVRCSLGGGCGGGSLGGGGGGLEGLGGGSGGLGLGSGLGNCGGPTADEGLPVEPV